VAVKRAVQGESAARRWYSEPELGRNDPEFQLAVLPVVEVGQRNRALRSVNLLVSGSAAAAIRPKEA
jgi:hypothetical protein